jgi:DNA-binding NarL/FixJ family response regulator
MINRYGNVPTVLVLNESSVAITVRQTLDVENYHIIETTDILEALEEATDYTQACIPDVILVRLDSASEEDFSAIDLLHADGLLRNIPVLVVSSTDSDEAARLLAQVCSEHGASSASPDGAKDAVKRLVKGRAATA